MAWCFEMLKCLLTRFDMYWLFWNVIATGLWWAWKSVQSFFLTHQHQVAHICGSKLGCHCSDDGLSPDRRSSIIWTNADVLLIGSLVANFIEIWIKIHFHARKWICTSRLKMAAIFASASVCSYNSRFRRIIMALFKQIFLILDTRTLQWKFTLSLYVLRKLRLVIWF